MRVHINRYPPFAEQAAGLPREPMRRLVESRLRYYRIFDPEAPHVLEVFFLPGNDKNPRFMYFMMELAYQRPLMPPTEKGHQSHPFTVWTWKTVGVGNAALVLEALERLLDIFLGEFLPVQDNDTCRRFRGSARGEAAFNPQEK